MKKTPFKMYSVSDKIAVINLIITALLTISITWFTIKSDSLSTFSVSKNLVNQFDEAIINNSVAQSEMAKLRKPPPGFSKMQEHLLYIYLNHLEFTFNAKENDIITIEAYRISVLDCLSYFKNNSDALNYMLHHGYPEDFMKSIEGIYQKSINREFRLSKNPI